MAYQQTTATSVEDLINKLATFASGLGWTVERNTIVLGNRTVSLKRAESDFVHIFNTNTLSIRIRASTGIDTSLAATAQPGVSAAEAESNCGSGPFASVFLFGDTNSTAYVNVVFDTGNSIFRHFCFGMIQKVGSWTGGTYFDALWLQTGSTWNATPLSTAHHPMFGFANGVEGGIRVDVPPASNTFAPIGTAGSYGFTPPYIVSGGTTDQRDQEGFYLSSVNSWSGVTPLRQIKLRVERGSGFWSEIGYVPGIRLVNIARWATGDEFSIGPDTWKVFPWWRQGVRPPGDTTGAYSGNYGYAYLKTL
jgi:hypothetical protein